MMRFCFHVMIASLFGVALLSGKADGQDEYPTAPHPVGWNQSTSGSGHRILPSGFGARTQPEYQAPPVSPYPPTQFATPRSGPNANLSQQNYPAQQTPQPQFAQPQFAQPQYAQPQFDQQQYAQPQYAQPQYDQPPFSQRPMAQPQVNQSAGSFQYPTTLLAPFQERIYGYQPNQAFHEPSNLFSQAGFRPQPSTPQPNYAQPTYAQPTYAQPRDSQPAYRQQGPQLNYQEGASPSDRAPSIQEPMAGGYDNGREVLPRPEPQSNYYQGPGYDSYQGYGGQPTYDHQSWCNGECQGACTGNYDVGYFGPGNPYVDSMNGPWNSACDSCGEAPCHCRRRLSFFGGIAGLVMTRDYESTVYLSYYDGNPRTSSLTSQSVELGSQIGYEATLGTCFGNGWAVVGSYWGLAQEDNSVSITGRPYTRLFGSSWLDYTPQGYAANSVFYWFNGSEAHRVTRQNEFHNLEINFMHAFLCGAPSCAPSCDPCGGCCEPAPSCWNVQYSIGARYFKFDEFFQYSASWVGGYTYAPRELFYDIETTNNMLGIQFGGLVQRSIRGCFSVYAGTKFGLYNNHINHHSHVYGPSGSAVVNTGTYTNTAYNVVSKKDDLAILGELNLGVRYQFSGCLRATLGYRALAVSGVALAPDQIPNDFSYIPGVRYIDSDGSLLMHGLYAGFEFRR